MLALPEKTIRENWSMVRNIINVVPTSFYSKDIIEWINSTGLVKGKYFGFIFGPFEDFAWRVFLSPDKEVRDLLLGTFSIFGIITKTLHLVCPKREITPRMKLRASLQNI